MGRSAGRNVLLERAVRGWNADWVVNLDSTDFIHTAGFQALGVEMERKPESQLIFGCHSMIMSLESAQKSYDLNMGEHTGTIVHCYRTRFDVCPMYWGHVMAHNHYGTIGTTSAIRADLAY